MYIVDEVHMLSTPAFNALLKILEEPPAHLMFILATTELHKVPATIKSRCQQFSFKRILPGQIAQRLEYVAGQEGIDLTPEGAALLARLADVGPDYPLSREKLSPVLAMYHAKDFDEALQKAERLVEDGGYGHTAALYVHPAQQEKINKHAAAMKACRILINTPSSHGGIGDLYNFKLTPSLTLGCGSWGGNSVSENVGVKHLLNIKTVAERRENMLWFRAPQKVYLKKGCMPVALDELGHVMGKKKCFIVTDSFLYQNGYVKPIEEKLDEMGILALYSKIDSLQREDHAVTVAEVKEVMDDAIAHSQKASAKKLVKRVFGKNTDSSDRILLSEKDFNI